VFSKAIIETHPYPSEEGMHPHRGQLFEDAYLNQKSLIARCGERSAIENHPLPGGAKLKND
jgi:hypothetical protein